MTKEQKLGKIEHMEDERVKKPKKRRRIRLTPFGKVLLGGAAGLTLVGSIIVGGTLVYRDITNNVPNFDATTQEIVQFVSNESTIDEILASQGVTLTTSTGSEEVITPDEALDELAVDLQLSEEIHGLNLEQYTGGLVHKPQPETYDRAATIALLEQFYELKDNSGSLSQEDRLFTRVCLELEANGKALNASLSQDAYAVLNNYAVCAVKANVLDCCGFDATEATHVSISRDSETGEMSVRFMDPDTGKTYTVSARDESRFNSKGFIDTVFKSMSRWEEQAGNNDNSGNVYNADRNRELLEGINEVKALTMMHSEIKGDKIVITTKMSDVKEKGRALVLTNSSTSESE